MDSTSHSDIEVSIEENSIQLYLLDDRFFLFIGLREGRVVARAMLFAADGAAGLYHVAVDEGCRRATS